MTQFIYLFKADAKANNNKYYQMQENSDGTFTASYGREGSKPQTKTYNFGYGIRNNWEKKYNEKIKKGYKDQTHLKQISTTSTSTKYKDIQNIDISNLIDKLMYKSKMQIANNYIIQTADVTQLQIYEAQKHIDELAKLAQIQPLTRSDINIINNKLIDLFHIMPRKMKKVNDNLWLDNNHISLSKIISTEQKLLDVMETQVNIVTPNIILKDGDEDKTILDFLDVSITLVLDNKVINSVKDMMESGYSHKLKRLFKVSDSKMDEKLMQHLLTTSNHQQQLFWHGSKTENILSILHKSLMIRPSNAVITYDAFGKGNYFASQYRKSENYTSLSNSYWANGNDDTAYIFLFNVHIGKQHIVSYSDRSLSYDYIQRKGCDSVWAKAGGSLMNDEYIVYKPEQSTVRYLLEITS